MVFHLRISPHYKGPSQRDNAIVFSLFSMMLLRVPMGSYWLGSQEIAHLPFPQRFDYVGTRDYTPWCAMGAALDRVRTDEFDSGLAGFEIVAEANRTS